ncbi:MAG: molybdopterin-dependent oxidoreductase, partial [Chloroflexi bacterium]|nr:molybdopterin-dependent oxidoreductase [Chloroflexota bacterium]
MKINLTINDMKKSFTCEPGETLMHLLRREGYHSVRFGSKSGETGAAAVLIDGKLVSSEVMLAAQADGHHIETVEGMAEGLNLHPIQQAFIRTGAIQSGYATPATILATKALLAKNPTPNEAEVRDALSGILCRETGYIKPVQAVLEAAAVLRGEEPTVIEPNVVAAIVSPDGGGAGERGSGGTAVGGGESQRIAMTKFVAAADAPDFKVVGKSETKVDAVKLAKGNPAFVDDIEMRGMLYAKLLTSPHAHAHILDIDDSEARALSGVHAVIHYKNIARVKYASGGQSYPNPPPYDQVSFDNKVRFVGDRVAAVAAESLEIAEQAMTLIKVEYEILTAVFDENEAIKKGAPIIHDEPDTQDIYDASRNISHHIEAEVGDVEQGFAEADHLFEHHYRVHQVQQCPIEPHIAISYWDPDERLVIRTSTQVPFHVRRMVAPLLDLPIKRIRVIKPRIGGGFGVKQEMLVEDIVGHLTIATGKPVRLELTRAEEFMSSRTRHPQTITFRSGVNNDGTLIAQELKMT